MLEMVTLMTKDIGVLDFVEHMVKKDAYVGLPSNLILADTDDNIAYMMLSPQPNRKNKIPFIGQRVLDGTTSENDWDGLVPVKDLPRSVNPEKGYLVTANNRQSPDNVINDYGAGLMSTGRSQRITEMIEQ